MPEAIFWDPDGNPIDVWEWAALFEDYEGRRIGDTHLGVYRVSTVWLGVDQRFGMGDRPMIFETMVFAKGTPYDLDRIHYATEAEAVEGHEAMVTLLRATIQTTADEVLETAPEDSDA